MQAGADLKRMIAGAVAGFLYGRSRPCASSDQMAVSASNGAPKCVLRRRQSSALLAFAVVTLLTACSETTETRVDDQTARAHGDIWVYSKTEIETQYRVLFSPHGLFGYRNAYQERHLIRNSAGKTISISDNLYALQRGGTWKKIECCQYFSEKGDLFNFDEKMVFIFANDRKFITDCPIYPRGRPNNDQEPPEKQADVTVFAEFDPKSHVFKIGTFDAGDNYLRFEIRAAQLRTGRERDDLTIREHWAFLYSRRKPFICDHSVPALGDLSTQSGLDDNAFQAGSTRKAQITVLPEATPSFVDRLQAFALRKQFTVAQAGSVERGDVSLALQGEEILTVAAGDKAGLWRLGFYRRMATPQSPLPLEQSVDVLLGEIRNELEPLPSVRFMD